jgi:hypothetical protein
MVERVVSLRQMFMVKGETVMPVPEGEITTSEIFAAEEAQDIEDFDIVFEMNEDKVPFEELKEELGIADDLS